MNNLRKDPRRASYMARDVVSPGGYLVIQTDAEEFYDLTFDPAQWITIFDSMLMPEEGFQGPIIPTIHYDYPQRLLIARRL